MGGVTWMLLASWLGCNAAPGPQAERPRPTFVAIAKPRVVGELHPDVLARMTRALETGTERAEVELIEQPSDCARAPCPQLDYVVVPRFEVVDHDYRVRLHLRSRGDDARVVATSEELCEVCSIEEAVDMVEAQASALWSKLAATRLGPPALRIESQPSNAVVLIDGIEVGRTPLHLPISIGEHRIRVEAPDHAAQTLDVVAVRGFEETLRLQLLPMQRPDDLRPLKVAGWSAFALGLAATAAGSVLVALHGQPYSGRCSGPDVDADGDCRFEYDTRLGGAITLGTGIVGIAIGTGLLSRWGLKRKRADDEAPRRLSGRMP